MSGRGSHENVFMIFGMNTINKCGSKRGVNEAVTDGRGSHGYRFYFTLNLLNRKDS